MSTKKNISYTVYRDNNKTDESTNFHINVSAEHPGYIVHRGLVKQLEEKRQGTASTKTRKEVRGGGKKPWKQKGTGKARAGSIRSPLWRGGGVIFGPKPKDYQVKLNGKEKQLALRNLLYDKQGVTILIDEQELSFNESKTQQIVNKLIALQIPKKQKILIVVSHKPKHLYLSTRNLTNIELIQANHLNIKSMLCAEHIIMTKESLKIIQEVYNAET
uniref:Large ribosomal subunit protein uL4c n=1 Tax=Izziella formosana TaxID=1653389 RepID=A0A1G4NUT9_9FLOR|nr:Ribosomal protein L4 [Izziella formosana]SCW22407.1 Ribosomal protein L4 [Izziella formosana]